MSEDVRYDERALADVAVICRRFIEEVQSLPAAAVALMLPALCQQIEGRLASEMMREREALLGRELTPEECDREAAFVGAELLRGEFEAQERLPDLLHMLRHEPPVLDEDLREMPAGEKQEMFSTLISDTEAMGSAIRASQGFWREMVEQEVDLETRMLIISYMQGVCGHHMLNEEIDRRKEELGRQLSDDDLNEVVAWVLYKRQALEELARTERDEMRSLVDRLGKHKRPPAASPPVQLQYIA